MRALKHMTDDDLVAVSNACAQNLSFYVAGWDYANTREQEREAYHKCRRQSRYLDGELKLRGLGTTCMTLCPLGVQ